MGSSNSNGRLVYICIAIILSLNLAGCGTIKKAGLIGASAGLGATAGSVISGGVLAPIAGSIVGASAASVVTTGLGTEEPIQALEITGDATVVQESPDNIWTMLGKITEFGGIGLLLFIGATYLLPLILGYLIPNGFERKKKKKV